MFDLAFSAVYSLARWHADWAIAERERHRLWFIELFTEVIQLRPSIGGQRPHVSTLFGRLFGLRRQWCRVYGDSVEMQAHKRVGIRTAELNLDSIGQVATQLFPTRVRVRLRFETFDRAGATFLNTGGPTLSMHAWRIHSISADTSLRRSMPGLTTSQ
jgi:hypothetical protein